jgi:hypothetical protein
MVLNVIDFNNALRENQRNRYCIYRNLELGHEVHIYNENSKLFKYLLSSKDFSEVKKPLIHDFSPFYEFLKFFLMKHIEGWFIEQDMIIYSSCYPQKTSPHILDIFDKNIHYVTFNFCTWEPVYIKHDKPTLVFLENSFKNLKFFLSHDFPVGGAEESYQTFALINCTHDDGMNFQDFLKKFNFTTEKPCFRHFYTIEINDQKELVSSLNEMDIDLTNIRQKLINISYEDLLKFDTFKIMP